MVNIQKAAIIGCGFVGASSAFSLLQKGIFSELVLIDANKKRQKGRQWTSAMVDHMHTR